MYWKVCCGPVMRHKQRADLTFKDNLSRSRHGWVRLTPAYSVRLVEQILTNHSDAIRILDPFSGTATTGLAAAQAGLHCDLFDINPFLVWLARAKCANYSQNEINQALKMADQIILYAQQISSQVDLWFPPISSIERWWFPQRLTPLAKIYKALGGAVPDPSPTKDLLLVAFCRLIMQWSNAAFNHQSLSFRADTGQLRLFDESEEIYQVFLNNVREIVPDAEEAVPGTAQALIRDSRQITVDAGSRYDIVVTSPPYPNRMSYIRELRPYMYWLGYLTEAREAGELDWAAIGGTWGIATSRLTDWTPANDYFALPRLGFLVKEIAQTSEILSRYIHKYFEDMAAHFVSLYDAVVPGGWLYYIVGNSKFYNTVVPVEQMFADLMRISGFEDTRIEVIRKRNSKKELFEFLVSARKPQ